MVLPSNVCPRCLTTRDTMFPHTCPGSPLRPIEPPPLIPDTIREALLHPPTQEPTMTFSTDRSLADVLGSTSTPVLTSALSRLNRDSLDRLLEAVIAEDTRRQGDLGPRFGNLYDSPMVQAYRFTGPTSSGGGWFTHAEVAAMRARGLQVVAVTVTPA